MNFEMLLLSALSKADEEPGDEIIDKVAEDSVNEGYQIVATSLDHQIKSKEIKYERGMELPIDFNTMAEIRHINKGINLSSHDYYIEGNKLYVTNNDFNKSNEEDEYDFVIRYVFSPPKMEDYSDKPITRSEYDYRIVLYGAYNVLLYKKRYNMAQMIKNEFDMLGGFVEQSKDRGGEE